MPDFSEGGAYVFFLAVPVLVTAYFCLMWMIDGNLDTVVGTSAIFVAFAILSVSYWTNVSVVRLVLLLAVGTAVAMFPFVMSQLDARTHRLQDTSELEKAHAALERDTGNVAARFEIARVLYKYGLVGHAIAIADATEKTLPTDHDPITNRSVRDMFRSEISRLKGWKDDPIPPDAFRPIPCPRCKRPNPPGTLICQSCNGPFLLDLTRNANQAERILPRLVMAWIILGVTLCLATFAGTRLRSMGAIALTVAILVAAAGIAIANVLPRTKLGTK